MLAKMWKKVLLAICIIACIYNIMSKLVNRGSLEANLHKANDGNTVFDFSSKKSTEEEMVEETTTSTKNTIPMSTNTAENQVVEDEESEEVVESETEEQEEEEKSSTINFKDFIFKW